ncbi:unnamed protein product [Echinostoma caproni]|uniref:CCR4-NOT transcription complex subunit 11 n=1 Tax=Echinostoma caproni TaxID=27848 RepID=A0A183A7D1_9TREM|nr:unnamed protein product [Echinostoma caproni]
MSLIPIILANLADAVALVLENMNNLQIDFEDASARELATSLLDARPIGGTFTEIIQRNDCFNESNDDRGANVCTSPNGTDGSLFARNNHPQVSGVTDKLKFIAGENDPRADLGDPVQSVPSSLPPDSMNETNEELYNLQDAILRALRDQDSIPPSLMKRLELITDKAMMEELKNSQSNPVQFQSVLFRCIGSEVDRNCAPFSFDYRPPSPSSPPPKTFEDELLDCLANQNGRDSDDSMTTITTSSSSRTGSIPGQSMGIEKLSISVNEPLDLTNLMEFIEGCSSHNPACLQALKVVLKLLTEQPEFQALIVERELTAPSITYADS